MVKTRKTGREMKSFDAWGSKYSDSATTKFTATSKEFSISFALVAGTE